MFEWLTVLSLQFVMLGSIKNVYITFASQEMDDDGNCG